jgi:hypothetical protein
MAVQQPGSLSQLPDLKKASADFQIGASTFVNALLDAGAMPPNNPAAITVQGQSAASSPVVESPTKTGSDGPVIISVSGETTPPPELALAQSAVQPPTQPVFTLAIRPDSGAQQAGAPQQNTATGNVINASPVPDPSLYQTPANSPGASSQAISAVNLNDSAAASTATQSTSNNNTVESSSISTPSIEVKPDFSGSSSDSKSGGQPDNKQAIVVTTDSVVSPGATLAPEPQFKVLEPTPATEYVHSEQMAAAAPAGTQVTDIRLQVDGAGNQHVNVRLVQEADGLRVTVRSNDPALAQSLQERVPELTTRLEQHHYQTELLLPERTDSAHFNPTNWGANSQQDSSGRNHGSGGQQNSHNKQDQQRNQQPWDEEESFSSLLGLRR